jgi:hypothetical protein
MAATESSKLWVAFRARFFHANSKRNLCFTATVICGLILTGIFRLTLPSPGLLQPDSYSYLDFSLSRTAGYPLLLSILAHFDPTYELLPFIQALILVLSVAFLVEACHRIYPSAITWTLVGCVILLNPFLWRYTQMMLTESLYASTCVLFLACMTMAIKNRPHGAYWLLSSGLLAGIAISIRPVGYGLVAAAGFGSVFWRGRFLWALALTMAPVVASVLALSAWNWSKHDVFSTQVLGGYEAIGKVALLVPHDLPGQNHEVAAQIAKNVEPVSSRLPTSLDRSRDYFWMTYLGFNDVRRDGVFPTLAAAVGAPDTRDEDLQPIATQVRVNELAGAIARQTILYRPLAYLQNVLIHFIALWTYPTMSDNKEQLHLRNMLCRPEFEKFYCQGPFTPVRIVVPTAVAVGKNLLLTLLMLLSVAVPLVFLLKKDSSPRLAAAAVTAMCINANYGIISLVEVGLPRYAIPMWPLLCIFTMELILLASGRLATADERGSIR